ncbi:DTW domain protein [Planctomycetes bacterium CA13]|uniref:tRNA-uridine aminocarboxypropyltransferase n=1 Tax=Novipirellula herctigrandis TaxID=2527986 RepID=A0A5C5YN35_9BACT|nr:DTW domain protein [Planctomycetes bacterium CA13]
MLILQHRRERFHPFNTARIVNQALSRCKLICEHNIDLATRLEKMAFSERVGILYPGEQAKLMTELSPEEHPDQLIILDGTWHHAKTLMRDIPRLQMLPRYRLAPAKPGQYRIRREPNAHALSTLEATVAALKSLEGDTEHLDTLLAAFAKMVDRQFAYAPTNWRSNARRRAGGSNVPRVLRDDATSIVIAYGEQQRGDKVRGRARRAQKPLPVFWTAKRLGTADWFQATIQSESLADKDFRTRLKLKDEHLEQTISPESFREAWQAFLRPSDCVVVYHPSTAKLLHNADADFAPCLTLKSVNTLAHPKGGSLDALIAANELATFPRDGTRASLRLANLEAFVEFLRCI